ncbi:MAG: DsrE/DsrF/DrsH-like family protein [Enhygromyxa sp.]
MGSPLDVVRPSPTQTFDLRGQPPDTLLEIVGRACAHAEPGAVIAAIVDDPAFVERVEQWLAGVDATLVVVERRGQVTEVLIRVEPPTISALEPRALARPAPLVQPERERCTLLVLRSDHEALLAALLVAKGAATRGMETSVFFSFWALELLRAPRPDPSKAEPELGLMQRLVKWLAPRGPRPGLGMLTALTRRRPLASLPELLHSAQQLGVRFTACTTSMSLMGLAPGDLHPYPNLDFGGVASFVEDARHSSISLVF